MCLQGHFTANNLQFPKSQQTFLCSVPGSEEHYHGGQGSLGGGEVSYTGHTHYRPSKCLKFYPYIISRKKNLRRKVLWTLTFLPSK